MSETRIRDLAGIITCDFCGIKNVNFANLTQRSEAEAAREQARVLTFEKPISICLSNHLQRPITSPL
jgi:Ribonuclease G/E